MNNLFAIVGPSGVGKTTVMRAIMDKNQEIISFTTRTQRSNEVEGQDYYFLTEDKFQHLLENDGLFENAEYLGNYYGITKEEFFPKMEANDCFFITVLDGLHQIKEHYDKVIAIYIYSDKESVKKQLEERGSLPEEITTRLNDFDKYISVKDEYPFDYIVNNRYGHFEETVQEIKDIILKEKTK